MWWDRGSDLLLPTHGARRGGVIAWYCALGVEEKGADAEPILEMALIMQTHRNRREGFSAHEDGMRCEDSTLCV